MKEAYLNSSTLEKSVDDLLAELTAIDYRHKPWKLNPDKAALLVLDMQNYFLDPASHAFTPSAPAILPNVEKLIFMADKNNMEIIFTRHVNDNLNAGRMDKWWKDMISDGSYEAEIYESLGQYDGKIVTKNQYDAFYNTDLEEYLHSKNIEQVIISGLLANLCCETTARSAFVRGFEVFFPFDATVAYNRVFHLSTFRNLGFGFCPLIRTSELISSINEES